MEHPNNDFNAYDPTPPAKRGMPWWGWLIIVFVVVAVLPCFGCIGWVAYVGTFGPDTSVYTANRVPQRFVDTASDVGALEPGENILFFYSDAVTDIKNGFYFVSDQRVVIYNEYDSPNDPLTVVEFDDIVDASISRDESFIFDSTIYLELEDGTVVSFPVSSENDGDLMFFEAIEEGYLADEAVEGP